MPGLGSHGRSAPDRACGRARCLLSLGLARSRPRARVLTVISAHAGVHNDLLILVPLQCCGLSSPCSTTALAESHAARAITSANVTPHKVAWGSANERRAHPITLHERLAACSESQMVHTNEAAL